MQEQSSCADTSRGDWIMRIFNVEVAERITPISKRTNRVLCGIFEFARIAKEVDFYSSSRKT
jgi:hypothetical protein